MRLSLFSPAGVEPDDCWDLPGVLERRPGGRALAELREQVIAADELGWHSFLLPGRRVVTGVNALLLSVYLAEYTTRLRHGQVGLIMPGWNPEWFAEDVAVADHLTGGRLDVGIGVGSAYAEWTELLRAADSLQDPHPPLLVPAGPRADLARISRSGATPVTAAAPDGATVCRFVAVGRTYEQARRIGMRAAPMAADHLASFGFTGGLEVLGRFDALTASGLLLVGTPGEVAGQLAASAAEHVIVIGCATDHERMLDTLELVSEFSVTI